MGKISVRRADGSTFDHRTTIKTRHVRLAHEHPVAVDFASLGPTPALAEISLNYKTTLEQLDVQPLSGHPALTSFSASVANVFDLARSRAVPR